MNVARIVPRERRLFLRDVTGRLGGNGRESFCCRCVSVARINCCDELASRRVDFTRRFSIIRVWKYSSRARKGDRLCSALTNRKLILPTCDTRSLRGVFDQFTLCPPTGRRDATGRHGAGIGMARRRPGPCPAGK